MRLLNGFKRLRQSRGYNVHSPFAYELITRVFRSPHSFYAFFDIPEKLRAHGADPRLITSFNHLSFRLVHHFKAQNILEVNPGTGLNTLFLMAPSTRVNCTWLERDTSGDSNPSILPLLPRQPRRVVVPPTTGDDPLALLGGQAVPEERLFVLVEELFSPEGEPFDAIFVNSSNPNLPPVEQLLKLRQERAFWVIHPITKEPGKQYWEQIVNDKRINVTFEGKETGTAFPWESLTPLRYFV